MVYGMAWRGMSWYVENIEITCFKALPWARSQVEGLLQACTVVTYSSCSLWAGIVNRELVNL